MGGLTNVILGRLFPLRESSRWQERAQGWLQRFGAPALLLSWLPLVGDLLCLLAGWLRLPWGPVIFSVPWQGAALHHHCSSDFTGYDVVALIGLFERPFIVNLYHYNYA